MPGLHFYCFWVKGKLPPPLPPHTLCPLTLPRLGLGASEEDEFQIWSIWKCYELYIYKSDPNVRIMSLKFEQEWNLTIKT